MDAKSSLIRAPYSFGYLGDRHATLSSLGIVEGRRNAL